MFCILDLVALTPLQIVEKSLRDTLKPLTSGENLIILSQYLAREIAFSGTVSSTK